MSFLEVTLFVTNDARHLPYLLHGLGELEQRGEIRLRVRARAPRVRDRLVVSAQGMERVARPYPWSYRMKIHDPHSGKTVRAGVDLQDWENFFSYGDLRSCDVLFKRSYNADIAERVQKKFGTVILPAGMTHGVPTPRRRLPFVMARMAGKIESFATDPTRITGWVRDRVAIKTETKANGHSNGSLPAARTNEPYAFFQVKCHGNGGWREAEELNQARAELIRVLRRNVGESYLGGMYFDGAPRAEFADCLSHLPTSHQEYLRLVENAVVVVSTNGFGRSVPWKLCEYLQLGKCVVTEDLAVGLPAPLKHGRDVSFFKTHEECARQCLTLLGDREARRRMEENARRYYVDHVAPAAAARRYLETALELAPNPNFTTDEAKA